MDEAARKKFNKEFEKVKAEALLEGCVQRAFLEQFNHPRASHTVEEKRLVTFFPKTFTVLETPEVKLFGTVFQKAKTLYFTAEWVGDKENHRHEFTR